MKAKKSKDLVNALLDDLLGGGNETSSVSGPPSVPDKGKSAPPTHDETVKLSESKIIPADFNKMPVRHGVTTPLGISSDAALIQSENLRVAQQRIFELEQEIERLRTENEQLAAAGETFRKRSDELQADNELKAQKLTDAKDRFASEKEILENTSKAKDRDLKELRMKIDEYEMRLSSNLQKIRVRERELENRLELVKMESAAVVRSKDEMILDLKRQIDQLASELESYRSKGQELNRQIGEKQEVLRRTVKALRLALSMLEGAGEESESLKKAK